MSSITLSQLPELSRLLSQCRRLIRLQTVLRGTAATILTGTGLATLACSADYLLVLPAGVRLLLLLTSVAIVLTVCLRRLILPTLRTLQADELGAAVDLRFPDLHEALATLASLERPDVSQLEAGSDLMRQLLLQRTARQLTQIQPRQVVPGRSTLIRLLQALICVLVILLSLFLWRDTTRLLAWRLLTPFANLAAPTNLWFELTQPQNVCAVGSDVTFAAVPRWRSTVPGVRPQQVILELQTQDGRPDQLSMTWDEARSHYSALLLDARQSLQYRVSGGGACSEWHSLTVAEPPRILAATLEETPPAYTRRPVQLVDGITGETFVFEGSQVRIQLQFSKPVVDLQLVWHDWKPLPARTANSGEEMSPGENSELLPEELAAAAAGQQMAGAAQSAADAVVPQLEWSADRLQADLQFTVSGGGRFEFVARDSVGLTNLEPADRRLTAVPDKPPVLQASGLQDGLQVRPDDVVPLNTIATDDIGIGQLELHYRRNQDAFRILPATPLQQGAEAIAHDFRLDLKPLGLQPGETIELRAKSADERPEPGPQVVWQGPWILKVSSDAPPLGLQALQQADRQLLEALQKLSQELALDAAKAAQLRARAQQDWTQPARTETRGLSEKEQTQGTQLQTLAEEAGQHPLMQQPADRLAKLAQQLRRDVAAELDSAAASERDPALAALQQAESKLQQIRSELDQATAQMQRAAKLEQDLVELNRLALDAEKLADDSLQLQQQQRNGTPAAGQTAEDFQQQLATERQRLQNEQQQLDQQLQDLLKKQQELLQAAREAQLDQAAALSRQLEQLAQRQQAVAAGTQEEARETGRDAEQLATQLQQLKGELEKVVQQLKQQPNAADPQVTQPDPAAIDQAVRELRQGNVTNAQQSVQQTAEQLAQAAAPQQNSTPDPAAPAPSPQSPQQQASQLQQQLQQLNQKLQQLAQERGPTEQSQQQVAQSLLQQLDQLTDAAAQQAQAIQQDSSNSEQAKSGAERSAQRAEDARRAAEAGQFQRAAEQLKTAAEDARQAAGQLASPEQQDRQAQLQQQGDDLSRMADSLRQMQSSNAAQNAARQQTQQELSDEAGRLPQQLQDLSERLSHPALGLQNLARPSQEASQAAQQGTDSGRQAAGDMQQAQMQQAGQAAEQAAGQLSRAGQLAAQAAQGLRDPSNPVPGEVGDSIGEALQNLQQAAERMAQENSQQPAVEGDSAASGQPGQSEPGEQPAGQGQPEQSGEPQQAGADGQPQAEGATSKQGSNGRQSSQPGQPGSEAGDQQSAQSPQGQGSAQSLADAAKSLKSAAKNSLPAKFTPGQLGSDSSQSSSDPGSRGNAARFDGVNPDVTVKRGQRRQWGQLQDQLDNDVQDGGREVLDSEYSGLIRSYRRNLARSRNAAPERTPGQP